VESDPALETTQTIRLPRSAKRRGAVTWCKLLSRVSRDRIWGGWSFAGRVLSPGAFLDVTDLPACCLVLECAGADRRGAYTYILWKLADTGWRELMRTACRNRDWTLDLGPIAHDELEPPKPVLVDPTGAGERFDKLLDTEIDRLDRKAQKLVLLAVYDRIAAKLVG